MAWCTTAQVRLLLNTDELTDLADDDADGSVDTGVDTAAINAAARLIWSKIQDRYSGTSGMAPESYTAGDGTYPILESMNAELAIPVFLSRQGADINIRDHWVMKWADEVRFYLADVVAT